MGFVTVQPPVANPQGSTVVDTYDRQNRYLETFYKKMGAVLDFVDDNGRSRDTFTSDDLPLTLRPTVNSWLWDGDGLVVFDGEESSFTGGMLFSSGYDRVGVSRISFTDHAYSGRRFAYDSSITFRYNSDKGVYYSSDNGIPPTHYIQTPYTITGTANTPRDGAFYFEIKRSYRQFGKFS